LLESSFSVEKLAPKLANLTGHGAAERPLMLVGALHRETGGFTLLQAPTAIGDMVIAILSLPTARLSLAMETITVAAFTGWDSATPAVLTAAVFGAMDVAGADRSGFRRRLS
jgi:hypothetical protein